VRRRTPASASASFAVLAAFAAIPGQAAENAGVPTPIISAAGEHPNVRTQLIWRHCAEGMVWDGGNCNGGALLVDRAHAVILANELGKREGLPWRLPRVAELRRLPNRDAHPPVLDRALYPAAPQAWHWSVTLNVQTDLANQYAYGNVMRARTGDYTEPLVFLRGWAVQLPSGQARGDFNKRTKLAVRLVRTVE